MSLNHMHYLSVVAQGDIDSLKIKEKSYGSSWKKRGGVGAFMMLARKWDRIEVLLDAQNPQYDILKGIEYNTSGDDSTILAEVRDLRRYLLLVEAEMVARGNIRSYSIHTPGTPEDGGQHARFSYSHGDDDDMPLTLQRS